MTDKIYKLGIDIGNKLVKIVGDGQEQPMVYPASLARYEQELSDKVVLSLAMGMPDDEYVSTAGQDFKVIKWLIGEHVVFIDNLPIEFEVKNIEVLPQEFGSF